MSRGARSDASRVGRAPDALVFLVIVAGVWIAWQIVRNALVLTTPPALSLRLGPDAPTVLTRAAEAELRAGRIAPARRYAHEALKRRPFSVAALRVAGLAADRDGDPEAADRMLTLAGNWSLRDDPAHSWLVRRRVEQGQTASALAHADTLMRRRTDVRPRYFDLMINLALRDDAQAQGALVSLLRRDPPWRLDFIIYALERREGLAVVAALAMAMKDGDHAMTQEERARLYQTLIAQGRTDVLRILLEDSGATAGSGLADGGFSREGGTPPFHWKLPASAGVLSEIAEDDAGQTALHLLVGGSARRTVAEQLVLLKPGRWRVSGRIRGVQGPRDGLAWVLVCATGGRELGSIPLTAGAPGAWTRFSGVVEAPQACPAQTLRLVALARDGGAPIEAWIDDVAATPAD